MKSWSVAALLFWACVVGSTLASIVSVSSDSQSRVVPTEELLQSFSDAWNAHDIDALMSFMSDGCEFHATAGPDVLGRSFFGLDQVKQGFLAAFTIFPDAQWLNPVHAIAVGSDGSVRGYTESTFTGTKTTSEGISQRVEARMVDVLIFDAAGKISIKNAFRKDRPPQTLSD